MDVFVAIASGNSLFWTISAGYRPVLFEVGLTVFVLCQIVMAGLLEFLDF